MGCRDAALCHEPQAIENKSVTCSQLARGCLKNLELITTTKDVTEKFVVFFSRGASVEFDLILIHFKIKKTKVVMHNISVHGQLSGGSIVRKFICPGMSFDEF